MSPDNHAEGPEKFSCCRKILLPLVVFHAQRPDVSMEIQIGPWCETDKKHLEGQYIPAYKDFEDYVREDLGEALEVPLASDDTWLNCISGSLGEGFPFLGQEIAR